MTIVRKNFKTIFQRKFYDNFHEKIYDNFSRQFKDNFSRTFYDNFYMTYSVLKCSFLTEVAGDLSELLNEAEQHLLRQTREDADGEEYHEVVDNAGDVEAFMSLHLHTAQVSYR